MVISVRSPSDRLQALLGALASARHFEEAARATLAAMLDAAGAALATSRWKKARLACATIHHRPGDGFRRFYVLEGDPKAGDASPRTVRPGSAWRWVSDRGSPIAINVDGTVLALGTPIERLAGPAAGFDTKETQRRLVDRDVTHVLAMPMRGPKGDIEGMFTLEVGCQAAGHVTELVWPVCVRELETLARAASPHLVELEATPKAFTPDPFLPVVGRVMSEIVESLRSFAQQSETILLTGATGTGKSRIARWCHEVSPRRGKPFERVDLHNVSEALQAGQLFGWKRGAFTDAVTDSRGAVDRAEGGTLFLDEIDKLSLASQATLLRLIEEKVYRPLNDDGGDRRADVRFVIGTNADLAAAVRRGVFRAELYYRINVLAVRMPTLDQRTEEIGAWAEYMTARAHADNGGAGEASLDPAGVRLLEQRRWPGNVRQLDNVVRRAYAFASSVDGKRVVRAEHVRRALSFEDGGVESPVVDAMLDAARAFVAEAKRRSDEGAPLLSLDRAEAFAGLVLGLAEVEHGKAAAFKLLGKEQLVADRNHTKTLRRELEKVAKLCAELGVAFPLRSLDADE